MEKNNKKICHIGNKWFYQEKGAHCQGNDYYVEQILCWMTIIENEYRLRKSLTTEMNSTTPSSLMWKYILWMQKIFYYFEKPLEQFVL